MASLVLEFRKIESGDKTNMTPFIRTQKQKQLFTKMTLVLYLNQSTLQLYKTWKNL